MSARGVEQIAERPTEQKTSLDELLRIVQRLHRGNPPAQRHHLVVPILAHDLDLRAQPHDLVPSPPQQGYPQCVVATLAAEHTAVAAALMIAVDVVLDILCEIAHGFTDCVP